MDINKLAAWYDQLETKPQALLLAVVLLFLYVVWDAMLSGNVFNQREQLRIELAKVDAEYQANQAQINIFTRGAGTNLNMSLSQQRDQLAKQLLKLDERLIVYAKHTVDPGQMINVLKKLLAEQSGLAWLGMEKEVAVDIADQINIGDQNLTSAPLYLHNFNLQFEGDFFTSLAYLERIQSLKWPIFWDEFDYQVINYPLAHVNLKIHTVSTEPSWVG